MRWPLPYWIVAWVMLCALASPQRAYADEPPPSAADKETARTLFKEGDEKYRAADYEGARKAFAAADGIMGVPTTGLEHARTLMKLGKLLEARELFLKVALRERLADELPAQQQARNEATQLGSVLAGRIPSIRVAISNLPRGVVAKLRVDGEEIPPAAVEFPRKLNPGDHVVNVLVAGFEPVTENVSIKESEERVIDVTLVSSGNERSPVDPWTEVAESPDGGFEIPVVSWIGFSVAAAGIIAGTITGVYAIKKQGDLEKPCRVECPDDLRGELDTALTVSHVSTATFAIAGAGIVVGVLGILLGGSSEDDGGNNVIFRPYVGPTGAGFVGRF